MILDEIRQLAETGRRREVKQQIDSALAQGIDPEEIIEKALIPAIGFLSVDDMRQEADILKILGVARCVQEGLKQLQPELEAKNSSYQVGTAILGTIEGDLHDIGKNILSLLLRCNGIEVIDLGVDVSKNAFVDAVREHPEAKIVCLSSLLTTVLPDMKKTVAALKKQYKKRDLLIMIGGASLTEKSAAEMGADVYTSNALDCARTARRYLLGDNA